MRWIVSVGLGFALVSSVMAQRAPVGFLRLVNVVAAGEGNARFLLEGQDLYPRGYALGQKTGGMGFKAGNYTIKVEKKGCRTGLREIEIRAGETQTLIAYAKPVRNQLDEIVSWDIELARLRQKASEKGYHLTLVSVGEEKELPVTVVVEGKRDPVTALVPQRKAQVIKVGTRRGGVRVAIDKEILTSFHTDDPGNYVVLIYTDPAGKRAAIHYYDPKFVVAG